MSWIRALLAAAALLLACNAAADPSPAREQDTATSQEQALFRKGLEHFRKGDHGLAIETWTRLRQSVGIDRGWRVLYNLGRAHEAAGDVTKAVEHYAGFLKAVARQPPSMRDASAATVSDSTERLAALAAAHGALSVTAPRRGLVLVRIGLAEPRPAGFTLYLKPRLHQVSFHPGSDRERTLDVELVAGKTAVIPAPDDPAPPTLERKPPVRERPTSSPGRALEFPTAWVVAGAAATVATGALSGVLYARASDRRRQAAALETSDPEYPRKKDAFDSAARTYQYSLVLPALFSAATLATLTVHFASKNDDVEVGVGVVPGGMRVGGRF